MINLVLVRHAKSDWGTPGVADHDRPLNERGYGDVARMAASLRSAELSVETIIASSALRARTTATTLGDELQQEPRIESRLYLSDPDTVLDVAASSGARRVMIVAHDPGLSELAGILSRGGIASMPTCAVASFIWDTDSWDVATSLDPDSWSFTSPRDLRDQR